MNGNSIYGFTTFTENGVMHQAADVALGAITPQSTATAIVASDILGDSVTGLSLSSTAPHHDHASISSSSPAPIAHDAAVDSALAEISHHHEHSHAGK
jgi:hypothetical protein